MGLLGGFPIQVADATFISAVARLRSLLCVQKDIDTSEMSCR
jgi:hypothetical protein